MAAAAAVIPGKRRQRHPVGNASLHVITVGDPTYEVVILGNLGSENWAVAVNDAGQVTGNYQDEEGKVNVFLWDSGTMVAAGSLRHRRRISMRRGRLPAGWKPLQDRTLFCTTASYPPGDRGGIQQGLCGQRCRGGSGAAAESAEEIPFLLQAGRLQLLAAGFDGYAARINNAGQMILQEVREEGFGALLWDQGADDRSRFSRRAGSLRSRSE